MRMERGKKMKTYVTDQDLSERMRSAWNPLGQSHIRDIGKRRKKIILFLQLPVFTTYVAIAYCNLGYSGMAYDQMRLGQIKSNFGKNKLFASFNVQMYIQYQSGCQKSTQNFILLQMPKLELNVQKFKILIFFT